MPIGKTREEYNEYQRKYQLERYHKRRKEAKKILGGRCVICGSKKELEIDHIDPKKKKISLNKLWSISKDSFLKELKKCQLLCKKHHIQKTSSDIYKERMRIIYGGR